MGGQACASVRVRVCARERAFRCGWGWGPGTITHFLNIRFEPWPALPATDLGEGVADISDISTPAVQSFSVDLTHTSQCMSRRPIAEPRAGKRDTPPLWRAHTQLYSSLSRSRRCCCCRDRWIMDAAAIASQSEQKADDAGFIWALFGEGDLIYRH